MRAHPRRGDEQRPAAVTAEHGDSAPSRERRLRYADYGLLRDECLMQPRAQAGLTLPQPHMAIDDDRLDGMTPPDKSDRLDEEGQLALVKRAGLVGLGRHLGAED